MLKTVENEKTLDKRFPEAVALVVSRSNKGLVNVCPIGYFSLASFTPKVWAISVYREHSTNKFIKETKEFVLCLPSLGQIIESYGSDKSWKDKIYNWDDKKLGNIKYGDSFKAMNFSPEASVKAK